MSVAHRVIKNTGFLYAKMGITMFISLYTTRLVLNSLGAADFGIFNIVGGAIAMLGFLNASMASATQRFMSYSEGEGDKEKQKKIFNISIVLHFIIALVLGIALLIAGFFFFNGVLNIDPSRVYAAKVVYGSLIISTMFTVMTVPYDAVLNAHENMKYYAIVGIIESFLKLGMALAVVYIVGDKLVIYGALMAFIPLITMSIMRVYCHNHYIECKISPRKYWDKKLMKEMSGFAGWSLFTSSSGIVSQYGMGIVLNSFFGVILNASQGIANQVSGILMTFAHSALKALNPIIVKREGSGERERAFEAAFIGCKVSFFLFLLFSIPFILEAPFILKIWLSNVPTWTVVFCRLQLLRILIEQLTLSISSMLGAEGNIKNYSQVRSILNILPILLTWLSFKIGLPPSSLYIIWILCWSIFGGVIDLYFANKNCNMKYSKYTKTVLFPCIKVAIIVYLITYVFQRILDEGIFRLIVVISGSLIVNLISIWVFGVKKSEREMGKIIYANIIYRLQKI